MAQINYAEKSISCKVVYYGPGVSGKTTNLQIIYEKTPGNNKGNMVSLKTEGDRTLYFDFLPLDLGQIKGFTTKFQLYTVPGQIYYNATRKLVLKGVDAIVFVADSSKKKKDENIESIENLIDNLKELNLEAKKDIPLVIQYNKRDMPDAMSIEELEKDLNKWGVPAFEAVAVESIGVFKTLKSVAKLFIQGFHEKYGFEVDYEEIEDVKNQIDKNTEPVIDTIPNNSDTIDLDMELDTDIDLSNNVDIEEEIKIEEKDEDKINFDNHRVDSADISVDDIDQIIDIETTSIDNNLDIDLNIDDLDTNNVSDSGITLNTNENSFNDDLSLDDDIMEDNDFSLDEVSINNKENSIEDDFLLDSDISLDDEKSIDADISIDDEISLEDEISMSFETNGNTATEDDFDIDIDSFDDNQQQNKSNTKSKNDDDLLNSLLSEDDTDDDTDDDFDELDSKLSDDIIKAKLELESKSNSTISIKKQEAKKIVKKSTGEKSIGNKTFVKRKKKKTLFEKVTSFFKK